MYTRREFFGKGLSAVALGVLAKHGLAAIPIAPLPESSIDAGSILGRTRPIAPVPSDPPIEIIGGLPFAAWWTGDSFDNSSIPFHQCENCSGEPPAPTEETEVAVIGGGISGLTTAYLLRHHKPVLFEMRDRFGGNAQGEVWEDTNFSLGCAYVITPDPGTFLNRFYRQLGLHRIVRVHSGADLIELNGEILDDFWKGMSEEDRKAFERYAEVVTYMAEESYPDIPLPEEDYEWILELDKKTFRQDLEERMAMPIPPLLAAAVQAYMYSSFAAGWDDVSAASGWNFLAAEEFGRWVFPGGVSAMADALWQKLARIEERFGSPQNPHYLRAESLVTDVRLADDDKVQITYYDRDGNHRSMLARRVVFGNSKRVAKWMIHKLEELDPQKYAAMRGTYHNGYVVINVLLDKPIELDFYDIFLLGDGDFPMTGAEFAEDSRVVDMLNGHYARPGKSPRSVLTLYWPLPFPSSRATLILEESWGEYAKSLVPQLDHMLAALGVPRSAVRQIRMTRWGHAVPIAAPGVIASGQAEALRRPIDGRIFFVNQDNWVLPAIENCLLDAETYADEIRRSLR